MERTRIGEIVSTRKAQMSSLPAWRSAVKGDPHLNEVFYFNDEVLNSADEVRNFNFEVRNLTIEAEHFNFEVRNFKVEVNNVTVEVFYFSRLSILLHR